MAHSAAAAESGSWVWVLEPVDADTTRLIVRMRGTWDPGLGDALMFGIANELGSLVMQPKTLRGISSGRRPLEARRGRESPPALVT